MPKFYGTLALDSSSGQYYQPIEAKSKSEAREIMFAHYNNKWAFVYDEIEFKGQAERFALEALEPTLCDQRPVHASN